MNIQNFHCFGRITFTSKLLFLHCNWKQSSKPQSQKYDIGWMQFHSMYFSLQGHGLIPNLSIDFDKQPFNLHPTFWFWKHVSFQPYRKVELSCLELFFWVATSHCEIKISSNDRPEIRTQEDFVPNGDACFEVKKDCRSISWAIIAWLKIKLLIRELKLNWELKKVWFH